MRLTIAYSKIKKRNLVLINNGTNQRETLSELPIRPPLECYFFTNAEADFNQTLHEDSLTQDYYIVFIWVKGHA